MYIIIIADIRENQGKLKGSGLKARVEFRPYDDSE